MCFLEITTQLTSKMSSISMNKPRDSLRIYLAAPLFNDMERSFNERLTGLLEPLAEVFLPQRDGKLMRDLVRGGMPIEAARRLVYEADINAIKNCTHILAVLDGRTIDEGVAFEIGYARALGKTCFGLKTDDRSLLQSGDNPIILAGCHEIFANALQLVNRIQLGSRCGDTVG